MARPYQDTVPGMLQVWVVANERRGERVLYVNSVGVSNLVLLQR